jgi:hypothetical protein
MVLWLLLRLLRLLLLLYLRRPCKPELLIRLGAAVLHDVQLAIS